MISVLLAGESERYTVSSFKKISRSDSFEAQRCNFKRSMNDKPKQLLLISTNQRTTKLINLSKKVALDWKRNGGIGIGGGPFKQTKASNENNVIVETFKNMNFRDWQVAIVSAATVLGTRAALAWALSWGAPVEVSSWALINIEIF